MKVLLNQDIDNLGRMGQVVEVAGGYARNYLIPRGLAVGVTRGGLKDIEERKRVLDIKAARQREGLEGLAEKIKSHQPIKIQARCSASGKLFGSITNRSIAAEIERLTGEEIDRHKIEVDEKIRTVGAHTAHVKLHPDVVFDLEFEVEGEGFVAEEPPEEEEAAEAAVEGVAPVEGMEAAGPDEGVEQAEAGALAEVPAGEENEEEDRAAAEGETPEGESRSTI